ncbi:hypothetical protein BZA70DRAFT_272502 [Myxozyma melibiosi]|uniref:Uncharacterized protein n=1 Tax=Myxozyma melibiosi TaxID=54550 RepID=A0ABR1FDK0_9ASCO
MSLTDTAIAFCTRSATVQTDRVSPSLFESKRVRPQISSDSTVSTLEDSQQPLVEFRQIHSVLSRKKQRLDCDAYTTQHTSSSTSLHSRQADLWGTSNDASSSQSKDQIIIHSQQTFLCTSSRQRNERLAVASTNFQAAQRHFLHRATVDIVVHANPALKGSDKAESTDVEGIATASGKSTESTIEDIAVPSFIGAESTAAVPRKSESRDHSSNASNTVPKFVPDSVEVTTDAPGVLKCNIITLLESSPPFSGAGRAVLDQTRRSEKTESASTEADLQSSINVANSLKFCTPPPKSSALRNRKIPRPGSLISLPAPPTSAETLLHEYPSQSSTYSSPDRFPERYPVFNATLTLYDLLGPLSSKEAYHVGFVDRSSTAVAEEPESEVDDDGAEAGEFAATSLRADHERRRSEKDGKIQIARRGKLTDGILTNTLEKQLKMAFRKSNYYAPCATCVRTKRMMKDTELARISSDENLDAEWPPQPCERGYWRIDVSPWNADEKLRFWNGVTKVIKTGRIGWVRMVVDDSNCRSDGDVVRFYCFGKVVVHIWVLLLIMSDRRLTRTDVSWVDSMGRTVIKMKRI